jgi:hypothetical protein
MTELNASGRLVRYGEFLFQVEKELIKSHFSNVLFQGDHVRITTDEGFLGAEGWFVLSLFVSRASMI